jgi:CheY-like chemotaxis protein
MVSILIADDEPHVSALLRAILTPSYQTIEAGDGAAALELLTEHQPDIAILDVAMPRRTGLELCQHLRADPRTADIGVIILTANGTPDDRAAALAAGADYFVTKPFSPVDIDRLVRALLAGRAAARQSPTSADGS